MEVWPGPRLQGHAVPQVAVPMGGLAFLIHARFQQFCRCLLPQGLPAPPRPTESALESEETPGVRVCMSWPGLFDGI